MTTMVSGKESRSRLAVLLEKRALKTPGRAPKDLQQNFEKWKDIAQLQDSSGLACIRGFRDHTLKGEWQGARSSRLNYQWHVIYVAIADRIKILVMEITPHDYRKKN